MLAFGGMARGSLISPELRKFIESRLPELHKALGPIAKADLRLVFNAMTGLDIGQTEGIADSTEKYHRKLIEMEKAGTLYLVGLDAAMKEVRRIRSHDR